MARFCHSCGAELGDPHGRFCPGCGAEVAAEPAALRGGGAPAAEPGRGGRRRRALLLAGCTLAIAAGAAGALLLLAREEPTEADARPSPRDLPRDVVAVVTHLPGDLGTLRRSELEHSLELVTRAAGMKAVPEPGDEQYGELKESALASLLEKVWLEGQAAEMGIAVDDRAVDRKRREIKAESFEDAAEYNEFLEESGYTGADVDRQVRLQLISERIEEAVSERSRQGSGGEKGQSRKEAEEQRFMEFVNAFNRKWRSRTVCAPGFVTERCSNGKQPVQPPPAATEGAP